MRSCHEFDLVMMVREYILSKNNHTIHQIGPGILEQIVTLTLYT